MVKQKAWEVLERKTKKHEKEKKQTQRIKGSSTDLSQNTHNSAFNFDSKKISELSHLLYEKGIHDVKKQLFLKVSS